MHNRQALLVVDVQDGFLNDNTYHVLDYIREKVQSSTYDYIIATQFVNHTDSPYVHFLNWDKMMSDDVDTHIDKIVASHADTIITKQTYSCDKELLDVLSEYHIDSVDIVGIDSDACVLSTALFLFDHHVDIRVDAQGCASSAGEEMHHAAMMIIKRNIGADRVLL